VLVQIQGRVINQFWLNLFVCLVNFACLLFCFVNIRPGKYLVRVVFKVISNLIILLRLCDVKFMSRLFIFNVN